MESNVREPLNIGSSEMVSINSLVTIIEKIAGVSLSRTYDLSAPKGVRGRNSDNSQVLKKLGWEPQINLHEGLTKTYEWIESQVKVGNRI
jgi:nucleoside-diphosphate-sugar epimerase